MGASITGYQGRRQASKVKCLDVAALFGAAIMRTNKQAIVVPFDTRLHQMRLNPRDSIMTNANKLKSKWGGGTNCSLGAQWLVDNSKPVDLIIYISDLESWVDSSGRYSWRSGTATLQAFDKIKRKNKNAKMVCIDLQANTSTQAPDRHDILNVGGFSDVVFDVIAQFNEHGMNPKHWVDVIETEVALP